MMSLTIPIHIAQTGFAGMAVSYKWNKRIGLDLVECDFEKPEEIQQYEEINKTDFRTRIGFGIALTEWPDKAVFDAWYNRMVQKMAETRPGPVIEDEDQEVYDYSHEAPIRRDAFGTDFILNDE